MEEADPLDISKEPDLVKDAQKDLSKIDVLVCGGCHEVFHFVEEFQQHKTGNECTNISVLKCENEEKSQIWGFTLWKTKQIKTYKTKGEELPTSWEIYQKWTKLDQIEKDLWVSAGKSIQFTHKTATGKVREASKEEKKVEKDPLALDNDVSTENEGGPKTGLRTSKDNEKEEYNVEKIIGKRFNPRKRMWEYEVKWENYAESTWEPSAHLQNCKALVQEFEDKLKAEKEQREKDKPPSRGRGRPRLNPLAPGTPPAPGGIKIVQKKPLSSPGSAVFVTSPGRPQRTSKQKALNQVKAWCGNISDEEGGMKRPLEDDAESDDSFEKKMKLEGESEDTEEDEPKTPPKKIAKIIHTYNNGTGKKLPDNVLIPDAKGVVRISQKQLPSLSSGVYIMSKSSGIIKLDPTASKIATSGGQAIVKVSPKVGQTQIKIIKKDDGSKRVIQTRLPEGNTTTVTAPVPIAPKPKVVPPVVNKTPPIIKKEVKKVEPPKPAPAKVVEKKEEPKFAEEEEDDSDDGIPELEFPTDLPLPEPDSPPGDFTLDPCTGKVVGVDYPEPTNEEKEAEKNLDNIVKLAAADITEDDLKPDSEPSTEAKAATTAPPTLVKTTTSTPLATIATPLAVIATPLTIATPPLAPIVSKSANKPTPSIVSAAMVNSNILQKTLQTPSPRPKTQPRIINQSLARPRNPIATVVRTPQVRPVSRPKSQPLPKPRFNISPMAPVKNVYSAKSNNITKKIGETTVTRTKVAAPVKKTPQKAAPPPTTVTVTKPISMPSLDEEPTPVLLTTAKPEGVALQAAVPTFALATPDRPMFISGDDGTVYQVAGQNEEGQTILVTHDSEGQQQCLLVTSGAIQDEAEQVAEPVLMQMQEPVEVAEEPLVAQFIRTEPPSPGGTHKVVVMLPNGDVMVTQVTPEEYASLELDK